jgi:hypothetical protein
MMVRAAPALHAPVAGLNALQVVQPDGDPSGRALCLATNGATLLFAEGLSREELEVLSERLNDHLQRVTGIPACARDSASVNFSRRKYFSRLQQEYPEMRVIDLDQMVCEQGPSSLRPFFVNDDRMGTEAGMGA